MQTQKSTQTKKFRMTLQLANPDRRRLPKISRCSSCSEKHPCPECGVEYYIQLCEAFGCTVDPSVATAIKTNWSFMQVTTRSASEPSLLPLAFCLEYMPFLKNLGIGSNHTVSHRGDGNWICRSISNGLMSLKALRILDLQRLGIDGQGLCQIADAICALPSLTDLILRYNYLGHAGGTDALVTIVKGAQPTLTFIDVSCNSLGYFNVRRLEQAATQARNAPPSVHILDDEPRLSISSDEPAPDAQKPKTSHKRAKCCCPYELSVEGNFVLEEVWNSVLHGIGVLLGLIGTWDLITKARGQSDTIFWACLVYGMSATTLFTASTLYHSTFLHERARKVFQMLDHCAIFILIAGTYTPIGLIALSNQPAAVVMVAIEWLIALVGIAIYLVSAHFPKLVDSLPYVLYEVALYVIMGHMCFMSYEQIIVPLSKDLLFTLMLGGLLYVVGVVFFILEQTKRIPIMHCIWHVFVLAAAIVHFFSVRSAVVNHLYESAHSEAAIAASKPLLAGFPRF